MYIALINTPNDIEKRKTRDLVQIYLEKKIAI